MKQPPPTPPQGSGITQAEWDSAEAMHRNMYLSYRVETDILGRLACLEKYMHIRRGLHWRVASLLFGGVSMFVIGVIGVIWALAATVLANLYVSVLWFVVAWALICLPVAIFKHFRGEA